MRTAEQILKEFATIAVVGASRHPYKPSYAVPLQLKRHGWRVIPVNPNVSTIWDETCYPTLADVPEPVDVVNVFRPSRQATDIVRQAIAIGAKAIWLQQGIVSPEGRELARAGGIDYVEDQCTAVVRAVHQLTHA